MKRFKVHYIRSGINYQPAYASTVAGAVKVARNKGFTDYQRGSPDIRPDHATVFERVDRNGGWGWELVATIKGKGITTTEYLDRKSYKDAEEQHRIAKERMHAAHSTMMAFNHVADKEYAKEQKA